VSATSSEYLERVRTALSREFATRDEQIEGRPVLVGHRSDFRWSWFGVRLETSMIIDDLDGTDVSTASLDAIVKAAVQTTLANRRSRSLGLQRGIAVIVVAVVPEASASARQWATTSHRRQFGLVSYPVVVDLGSRAVIRRERMLFGGIFASFFRDLTDRVLRASLAELA
jgi:hypothetical protein